MPYLIKFCVLAIIILSGEGEAQMWSRVEANPDIPVKAGFDTKRAIFWEAPNFTPLRDPTWEALSQALKLDRVQAYTPVLVLEVGGKTLVLVTSQMSYHHVAQGEVNDEPWMVTF